MRICGRCSVFTAVPMGGGTGPEARSSIRAGWWSPARAGVGWSQSRPERRRSTDMDAVVRLDRVTKPYRGVPAVTDVDFDLARGEIHALLGENGAGKSTLTKIMAGVVEATSGRMIHNGQEVRYRTPHQALDAGIAMVFQETSLV